MYLSYVLWLMNFKNLHNVQSYPKAKSARSCTKPQKWSPETRSSPKLTESFYPQSLSCVWIFLTPWTVAHQAPLSMGDSVQYSPSKNTGVGCNFLLQGIFLAQGLNLCLLHLLHLIWQVDYLSLPHLESPFAIVAIALLTLTSKLPDPKLAKFGVQNFGWSKNAHPGSHLVT